jgi:hypothetical protein
VFLHVPTQMQTGTALTRRMNVRINITGLTKHDIPGGWRFHCGRFTIPVTGQCRVGVWSSGLLQESD